jgi:hypothetical protein
MLLLFFNGGAAFASAGNINASVLIGNLWPPLNAVSEADAVFWSEAELYEWFNTAGRKLAGAGAVFVVRDTSLSSSVGVGSYSLPAAHNATIQADLAGKVLRSRTTQEVEALDADWVNTTGVPVAFLEDVEGVKKITLFPTPNLASDALAIDLLMRAIPAEVTAAAGFLVAPPALAEYFSFSIIAEARAKEGRAQMPEITAWLKSICSQYEQAVQGYLGGA